MIDIPGYEIVKKIGQGGMATVLLAIQKATKRHVAIKIMAPYLSADPEYSQRFVKEAYMANLSHPNIITIFDAGVVNEQNYIVMEYAEGGNFEQLIESGISLKTVIDVVRQIANALQYSSDNHVFHRDVKPENILFTRDGQALLVDFGIAKMANSQTKITSIGEVVGSANYMSPEQARGVEIDYRSDIYSLGMVFYEALTNHKPYDAPDSYVITQKQVHDPIPLLPEKLLPLQSIINQALAKNPANRFSSAQKFAAALNAFEVDIVESDPDFLEIINTDVFDWVMEDVKLNDCTVVRNYDDGSSYPRQLNDAALEKTSLNIESVSKSEYLNQMPTLIDKKQRRNSWIIFSLIGVIVIGIVLFLSNASELLFKGFRADRAIDKKVSEKVIFENIDINNDLKINEREIEVNKLIQLASQYMTKSQFTTPLNENAFNVYSKILKLHPGNTAAHQGLKDIVEKYILLAKESLNKEMYIRAKFFTKKGLKITPNSNELVNLLTEIEDVEPLFSNSDLVYEVASFNQDENISTINGVSRHIDPLVATKLAKHHLNNRIYSMLLSQCNQTIEKYNNSCLEIYKRYYSGEVIYFPNTVLNFIRSTSVVSVQFNKPKLALWLKKYSVEISSIIKNSNRKTAIQTIIAIENYKSVIPLYYMLRMPVLKIDVKLMEILEAKVNVKNILNSEDFSFFIKNRFSNIQQIGNFKIVNSLEITPFAGRLQKLLNRELSIRNFDVASSLVTLEGEYRYVKGEDVRLKLVLLDENNKVKDLEYMQIDSHFFKTSDRDYLTSIEDIIPSEAQQQSFNFPVNALVSNNASSNAFFVGESLELKIQFEQPGFYYLAIHVKRKNDEFSYLQAIRKDNQPFVQTVASDQMGKYLKIGEFDTELPLGVEILQLIASNVNLQKYLPPTHWDDKRKQFIIENSEGNIYFGLNQVRISANNIPRHAFSSDPHWQEKILITRIID